MTLLPKPLCILRALAVVLVATACTQGSRSALPAPSPLPTATTPSPSPGRSSAPVAETSHQEPREKWRVRFIVEVRAHDEKPVPGTELINLHDRAPLGVTDTEGRANVWVGWGDSIIAVKGNRGGIASCSPPRGSPREVTLYIAEAGGFVGRVVDRDSGQPIAGAILALHPTHGDSVTVPPANVWPRPAQKHKSPPPSWAYQCASFGLDPRIALSDGEDALRTDEDGRFDVPLRIDEVGQLIACAKGYAPGWGPGILNRERGKNSSVNEIELSLHRTDEFRSVIVDSAGAGVAGIKVGNIPHAIRHYLSVWGHTTTTGDGSFSLPLDPRASHDLKLESSSGVERTYHGLSSTSKVAKLSMPSSIYPRNVKVTCGKPLDLSGARVSAYAVPIPHHIFDRHLEVPGSSPSRGFRKVLLGDEPSVVFVYGSCGVALRRLETGFGNEKLTFRLPAKKSSALKFKVVTPNGLPVFRQVVLAKEIDGVHYPIVYEWSSDQGTTSIPAVPAGRWALSSDGGPWVTVNHPRRKPTIVVTQPASSRKP